MLACGGAYAERGVAGNTHCMFTWDGNDGPSGRVVLEDKSANGVFVRFSRVARVFLRRNADDSVLRFRSTTRNWEWMPISD